MFYTFQQQVIEVVIDFFFHQDMFMYHHIKLSILIKFVEFLVS